jgi:hypothetical protein
MDVIIRRLADCLGDILYDSLLDYLSDQLLVNLLILSAHVVNNLARFFRHLPVMCLSTVLSLMAVLVIGPAVAVWTWWVTSEGPISKTQP